MDDEPCSNDTPDVDYLVNGLDTSVPCHHTSFEAISDDAVTDDPVETTTIETASISNGVDDLIDETYYPSFYSCTTSSPEKLVNSSSSTDNSKVAITIRFGYEVYTPTPKPTVALSRKEAMNSNDEEPVDLDAILEEFELRLARGVASTLGLVDCYDDAGIPTSFEGDTKFVVFDVARSAIDGTPLTFPEATFPLHRYTKRRRMLRSQLKLRRVNEVSSIVGVSSDPLDVVETEKSSCRTSVSLDKPADCKPIVGSMTAYITGPVNTFKPSEFYNAIRDYIINEQESYADVEDLLHVEFTGARDAEIVKPTTTGRVVGIDGESEPAGRKMSLIGISLAAIATLVVLFFVALIAANRRRNRRIALDENNANLDDNFPEMQSTLTNKSDNSQAIVLAPTCVRSDDEESINEEEGESLHDSNSHVGTVCEVADALIEQPYPSVAQLVVLDDNTPTPSEDQIDQLIQHGDWEGVLAVAHRSATNASNNAANGQDTGPNEDNLLSPYTPMSARKEDDDDGITIVGVRGGEGSDEKSAVLV